MVPDQDPAVPTVDFQAFGHKAIVRCVVCDAGDRARWPRIVRTLDAHGAGSPSSIAKEEGTPEAFTGLLAGPGVVNGVQSEVDFGTFSTEGRFFILTAPAVGHLTHSVVAAAASADIALVLVDAAEGVQPKTRLYSYLFGLLGIRQAVLSVDGTKELDSRRFEAISRDYRQFAEKVGIGIVRPIPVCSESGDNLATPSLQLGWYRGPTLVECLESLSEDTRDTKGGFRMPVLWVENSDQDFSPVAGIITSGRARKGDTVRILPEGVESRISRIVQPSGGGPVDSRRAAVLILDPKPRVLPGDVLRRSNDVLPPVADQFEASLIWLHDEPMLPGRTYLLKLASQSVLATVAPLKHRVNVNTLEPTAAERLERNDIGVVETELDAPVAFQPFDQDTTLGVFTLFDRVTGERVGAGLLHFALRRASNIRWQTLDVNKAARARQKGQTACLIWLTGLSGAGKSTIANLVERRLLSMNRHTYLLDGDNVRHGLNRDLGFTEQDRVENIRRAGEVAKLMVDAGLIVLASFISPFRAERDMIRGLLNSQEFIEVFIDTPLSVAEQRDPKGLYAKARRGELKNFTGIDSPYELPEKPEIRIDTTRTSAEQAANEIVQYLLGRADGEAS